MTCYNPIPIKKNWNILAKKWELTFLPHKTKKDINFEPFNHTFIKCSKCLGCRITHAQNWGNRCSIEASYYPYNYFITLTYNPENLPLTKKTQKPTLNKKHLKKFIKDIRQHYKRKYKHLGIRYFACGEYGKNGRPHYHINMFNLPIHDLKKFGSNKINDNYYISETINKYWKYGFTIIGEFSELTANYTARYTLKKITQNKFIKSKNYNNGNLKIKDYDPGRDIIPEFICMSTNPGLGYQYLIENMTKIYTNNSILIKTKKQNYYIQPFAYYNRKMKEIDPDFIKQKNDKNNEIYNKQLKYQLEKSDHTYLDMLRDQQIILHKKIKSLYSKRF